LEAGGEGQAPVTTKKKTRARKRVSPSILPAQPSIVNHQSSIINHHIHPSNRLVRMDPPGSAALPLTR
jgi:hypothetical protein